MQPSKPLQQARQAHEQLENRLEVLQLRVEELEQVLQPLGLRHEILLVDEVLAVGDLAFQRKCMGKMGEVAGAGRSPFTRSGYRALYRRSQGVPRLINIIADRALTGAFAQEKEHLNILITF